MRIIIVDDEINARETMRLLIDRISSDIKIVAEIESVEQARNLHEIDFDVLLLDIELIDGTGFEILENNSLQNVHIIFTTAYHEHAIKAFKKNAVDYILKPIDLDELKSALDKCQSKIQKNEDYKNLIERLEGDILGIKIQIHGLNSIEFIYSNDIKYLKANGAYSDIILSSDRNILSSKPLKYYENKLEKTKFFRVNRFELVNIQYALRFNKNVENGIISMGDGLEFKIARRKKASFKLWLHSNR